MLAQRDNVVLETLNSNENVSILNILIFRKYLNIVMFVLLGLLTLAIQIIFLISYISAIRDGHINITEKEELARINNLLTSVTSGDFPYILKSVQQKNNDKIKPPTMQNNDKIKPLTMQTTGREEDAPKTGKNSTQSHSKIVPKNA